MPQPQKYLDSADKQRAYRHRKAMKDIEREKAEIRLQRIRVAVGLAVQNGTLPASILEDSEFGDWCSNLVEYLSRQQSLFGKRKK